MSNYRESKLEYYYIAHVSITLPEYDKIFNLAIKVKAHDGIVALFHDYEAALKYAEELDNDPY